jgi:uncharacterized peroxidase-related enzyme
VTQSGSLVSQLNLWTTARALLEYHEVLLRGGSPFTAAERELIAAYVSELNNCNYCRAVHSQTAVALGIRADVMANVISDAQNADLERPMRPVLVFVRKLTLLPGEISGRLSSPTALSGNSRSR